MSARYCTLPLLLVVLLAPLALAQNAETFRVWVEDKNPEHPFYQQGWPEGYVVDGVDGAVGVQGRDLILERGVTYTIEMVNVPGHHPFYIATTPAGGGGDVYDEGVTGNFATGNAVVTITPSDQTPSLLYYQCGDHTFMGGRIHVVGRMDVDLEPIASGFVAPVYLAEAPDTSGRLFVVDQAGTVRIIGPAGDLLPEPFLDLTDRLVDLQDGFDERGLLGLAFHPDFAANGRFFVHYSAPLRDDGPDEWNHTAHVAEFTVSNNPDAADPDSERILMQIDHPQFNHNGGALAFGPDGYLYISLGDGGGSNDTGMGHVDDWYEVNAGGNAQAHDQNLLGSILRIDVEEEPYGIPADNPFVGEAGLDEIWAFGLRNPYRMSFDSAGDAELLVGDAGQGLWEAVYHVEAGGNYGWNVREGAHCFSTDAPLEGRPSCPQEDPDGRPLAPPVIQYPHARQADGLGVVIVGGHVYRGSTVPELYGGYVFADWSRSFGAPAGRVFVATERREETFWGFSELRFANRPDGELGRYVLGFGRDADGDVYVLTSAMTGPTGTTGAVHRLAPAGTVATAEAPRPGTPLALGANHPNPFAGATTLTLNLAEAAPVHVAVYDALGRRVATLLDAALPAGAHDLAWDGRDASGRMAASGAYVIRAAAAGATAARVVTLMR